MRGVYQPKNQWGHWETGDKVCAFLREHDYVGAGEGRPQLGLGWPSDDNPEFK